MSATRFMWIFIGGGLGSVARFAVGSVLLARLGAGFPFGTLAVNLIGSALLAALVHVALAGDAISRRSGSDSPRDSSAASRPTRRSARRRSRSCRAARGAWPPHTSRSR
jgi:hypothetical protein